eukprot:12532911-Ditylum_brightwellii.AAC.2
MKRVTATGNDLLSNIKVHGSCRHSTDECNITIAHSKGCICYEHKEGSCKSKKTKDLNTIIDKMITKAFRCQEKKEKFNLNK